MFIHLKQKESRKNKVKKLVFYRNCLLMNIKKMVGLQWPQGAFAYRGSKATYGVYIIRRDIWVSLKNLNLVTLGLLKNVARYASRRNRPTRNCQCCLLVFATTPKESAQKRNKTRSSNLCGCAVHVCPQPFYKPIPNSQSNSNSIIHQNSSFNFALICLHFIC